MSADNTAAINVSIAALTPAVATALAGMAWGLHPEALIAGHLRAGRLVELVPGTALDVPLYWQHARAATSVMEGLSRAVLAAAARALRPAGPGQPRCCV